MSKPLWRGPWLGVVEPIPPVPASGTWEIPLESVTGFAASLFQNGPIGDTEKGIVVEETDATFSATMIKLNGGAAVPVAGLPAGFTVTLARHFWGNWVNPEDEGGLGGACGQITLTDDTGIIAAFLTSFPGNTPVYAVVTYAGPPALAALLGKVVNAEQTPVYLGTHSFVAVGASSGAPRLYGNYEVL